jgi:hypothetical protein
MKIRRGFVWIPILLLVLGVVVLGGSAYLYLQTHAVNKNIQVTVPTSTVFTTTSLPTPSAIIDTKSLTPALSTSFSITGAATDTEAISVFLVRANTFDKDNNYNDIVQGGKYSYESLSNTVVKGRWSAPFQISSSDTTGFFQVLVYDATSKTYLTGGTFGFLENLP